MHRMRPINSVQFHVTQILTVLSLCAVSFPELQLIILPFNSCNFFCLKVVISFPSCLVPLCIVSASACSLSSFLICYLLELTSVRPSCTYLCVLKLVPPGCGQGLCCVAVNCGAEFLPCLLKAWRALAFSQGCFHRQCSHCALSRSQGTSHNHRLRAGSAEGWCIHLSRQLRKCLKE